MKRFGCVVVLVFMALPLLVCTAPLDACGTVQCGAVPPLLTDCPPPPNQDTKWFKHNQTCYLAAPIPDRATPAWFFSQCAGSVWVEPSAYMAILSNNADMITILQNTVLDYDDGSTDPPPLIYVGATTMYIDGKPRWLDGTDVNVGVLGLCENRPLVKGECVVIQVDDPWTPKLCYRTVSCTRPDLTYYNNNYLCAVDLQSISTLECDPGWRRGYGDSCYNLTISTSSWNEFFCDNADDSSSYNNLAIISTAQEAIHLGNLMKRCYESSAPTILSVGALIGITSQGFNTNDYHWLDGSVCPANGMGNYLDFDPDYTGDQCAGLSLERKGNGACSKSANGVLCLHSIICRSGQCNGAIYEKRTKTSTVINETIWDNIYESTIDCPVPPDLTTTSETGTSTKQQTTTVVTTTLSSTSTDFTTTEISSAATQSATDPAAETTINATTVTAASFTPKTITIITTTGPTIPTISTVTPTATTSTGTPTATTSTVTPTATTSTVTPTATTSTGTPTATTSTVTPTATTLLETTTVTKIATASIQQTTNNATILATTTKTTKMTSDPKTAAMLTTIVTAIPTPTTITTSVATLATETVTVTATAANATTRIATTAVTATETSMETTSAAIITTTAATNRTSTATMKLTTTAEVITTSDTTTTTTIITSAAINSETTEASTATTAQVTPHVTTTVTDTNTTSSVAETTVVTTISSTPAIATTATTLTNSTTTTITSFAIMTSSTVPFQTTETEVNTTTPNARNITVTSVQYSSATRITPTTVTTAIPASAVSYSFFTPTSVTPTNVPTISVPLTQVSTTSDSNISGVTNTDNVSVIVSSTKSVVTHSQLPTSLLLSTHSATSLNMNMTTEYSSPVYTTITTATQVTDSKRSTDHITTMLVPTDTSSSSSSISTEVNSLSPFTKETTTSNFNHRTTNHSTAASTTTSSVANYTTTRVKPNVISLPWWAWLLLALGFFLLICCWTVFCVAVVILNCKRQNLNTVKPLDSEAASVAPVDPEDSAKPPVINTVPQIVEESIADSGIDLDGVHLSPRSYSNPGKQFGSVKSMLSLASTNASDAIPRAHTHGSAMLRRHALTSDNLLAPSVRDTLAKQDDDIFTEKGSNRSLASIASDDGHVFADRSVEDLSGSDAATRSAGRSSEVYVAEHAIVMPRLSLRSLRIF